MSSIQNIDYHQLEAYRRMRIPAFGDNANKLFSPDERE